MSRYEYIIDIEFTIICRSSTVNIEFVLCIGSNCSSSRCRRKCISDTSACNGTPKSGPINTSIITKCSHMNRTSSSSNSIGRGRKKSNPITNQGNSGSISFHTSEILWLPIATQNSKSRRNYTRTITTCG